jgi:radical SAM protein with 4Fe4S-binding SPASM domain
MTGPQFARLAAVADERHIPLSVTLELTLACNLRCWHCYNFDRELRRHPDPARHEALSASEIHCLIDEVRAEGTLFLAFTGGEPTSHPAIVDFVAHASSAGLFVRLKSNGTRLTRARITRLAEAGLKAIDVSVYGGTPDVHDEFVRRHGAFARTVAGIEEARNAGIAVQIAFVLSRANADATEAMIALADRLGVPYSLDSHLTARYDGSRSSLDLCLDRPTFERLYRGPLARYLSPGRKASRVACPCARSVCGIASSGEVYPCIGAPLPAGNVRGSSFREVWRHSPTLQWVRGLRNEDFQACASCSHLSYCRRNSGVMLNNTGDFTGPARFGDDASCIEAEVIHGLCESNASVAPVAGSL